MVRELLLGDNPFLGVSHLAQERALEEKRGLSIGRMAEVLEAAYEAGATGYTFSAHDTNLELLGYIAEKNPVLLRNLNYYILVPYAYAYVRRATSLGMVGLAREVLRNILGGGVLSALRALASMDADRLAALFISWELNPYLKLLPRDRVRAVLLHEVATELLVALDAPGLVEALYRRVKRELGLGFGLETRNIGRLADWVEDNGLRVDYVMTPMNKLGYQMTPGREEAEEAIRRLSARTRIIAINILASGAIGLEEAIEYLRRLRREVYAIAVGTSKPWRARENFAKLRRSLLDEDQA